MNRVSFTVKQLKAANPCSSGLNDLSKSIDLSNDETIIDLINTESDNSISDYLWSLKLTSLTNEEKIDISLKVAIFSAELSLHFFTEKFPNEERPKRAIETAKHYLKNKTKENAADAAADAYAADAAYAAYAAADAYAAAADAYAAARAAAADARADVLKKIKDYFLDLLKDYI